MGSWFLPAILALLLWGLWGFLPKLASENLDHGSIAIYQLLGGITAAAVFLLLRKEHIEFDMKSVSYAMVSGIAGFAGAFFFLMALSRGKVSVVIPVTGLYPVLSILLAFIILKEPIALKQLAGIILAVIAIILMGL